MQEKIKNMQPTVSAPMLAEERDCSPHQMQLAVHSHALQSSSSPSCEQQPARNAAACAHPRRQAADCAGKPASKEITVDPKKQPRSDRNRTRVAFGSCLPVEAATKPSATASKRPVSVAAALLATAYDAPVSAANETTTITAPKTTARSPIIVRAAHTNTVTASTASLCSSTPSGSRDDVKARQDETSSPVMLNPLQPKRSLKVHLHEGQLWPRLERALHKYHQRAGNADSCHKENYVHKEGHRAEVDCAAPCMPHPLTDSLLDPSLEDSSKVEVEGDPATGKSHSLALLGFSDIRIRRVMADLACALMPHNCFSDATAVSRVIAASQVPAAARVAFCMGLTFLTASSTAAARDAKRRRSLHIHTEGKRGNFVAGACKAHNSVCEYGRLDRVQGCHQVVAFTDWSLHIASS